LSHPIFHTYKVTRAAATLCAAGVALGDIHLHFGGRRGTYDIGLAPVARLGAVGRQWRRGALHGRRGTWRHPSALCVAGMALGDMDGAFAWQARRF